jgi:cation transport ATPase
VSRDLPPVVDWFVNLVATYGVLPVIFVGSGLILTVWISLGTLLDRAERRRARRAEAAQRQADLDTCNAIWNTPSPRREKP